MACQRYSLAHQRILRDPQFRPKLQDQMQLKLTPIESLLGLPDRHKPVLLLGILVQREEGRFYLEDLTGQVPLDWTDTVLGDAFFVTEESIVLVEGIFDDGLFHVETLGPPCLERRLDTVNMLRQQVSHPMVNGKESSIDEGSMVVFSDCCLDQPAVVQNLEGLLARFESTPEAAPLLVFMGNLSSDPNTPPRLDELANVLDRFPRVSRKAHVLLIPGPNDTASSVLPWPALPKNAALEETVRHVHYGTNPCRILWGGRDSVLFRYDLQAVLEQRQLRLSSSSNEDVHLRLTKTILHQGHVAPIAGVPIFWNYDAALRLYPLPDVLVLGGDGQSTVDGWDLMYEKCHVVHPAGKEGSYCIYPSSYDDVMEDDEESPGIEYSAQA